MSTQSMSNGGQTQANGRSDASGVAGLSRAQGAAAGTPVDLSIDLAGIKSPNPFWLASAPPTNMGGMVQRAFDLGWGGAVWKTLGEPIINVSSRSAAHRLRGAADARLEQHRADHRPAARGELPRDRRGQEEAFPSTR